jgi:Cu(I)/Ag(I) efflux system membrane fusion protein
MRGSWVWLLGSVACGRAAGEEDPHAGHGAPAGGTGLATVDVAPGVVEILAIRTEPATAGGAVAVAHRAPATVAWDPLDVTRVAAQAGGQVRELRLPRPGEEVRRGAVIARMYQPEIRAAYEELRVASGLGEPWVSAARSRLAASGVPAGEIDAALARGESPETYSVRAPTGGVVIQRAATEGAWVGDGGLIAVLGDPSALVVDMVVSGVAPAAGTEVALRDPASGVVWPATVASVLPTSDVAGLQVRLVPASAPPVGRPLVAEWTEDTPAWGVWVPQTALVDTGRRRVVFVEVAPGRYEPRPVEVGIKADQRVQITAGLAEGEPVVVSGTFLLDSETQIGAMGHAGHGS